MCIAGDAPCPNACRCGCNSGEYECACEAAMQIVYQNRVPHASQEVIDSEVWSWQDGTVDHIGDSVAQAIAAQWHSPGSPNSTALSTMGAVTWDMRIEDFASDVEYLLAGQEDRWALDALETYIQAAQEGEL